jgi:hypothetical protein
MQPNIAILDRRNIRDIRPDVLDDKDQLFILPYDYYRKTTPEERALLGHQTALYGLPTLELVQWIKDYIGGRSAIEIGAAHGLLAKALGIPATDNFMQDDPRVQAAYKQMGQRTVTYGAHVEKLSADQAVEKYKPQVVVASWVTNLYKPERHEAGGNVWGVDEDALLDSVDAYVFVGNHSAHNGKSIWSRPHRFVEQNFVFSRSMRPQDDFLCVWEK